MEQALLYIAGAIMMGLGAWVPQSVSASLAAAFSKVPLVSLS